MFNCYLYEYLTVISISMFSPPLVNLVKPCGKGNYWRKDTTKIGIKVDKSCWKMKRSPDENTNKTVH